MLRAARGAVMGLWAAVGLTLVWVLVWKLRFAAAPDLLIALAATTAIVGLGALGQALRTIPGPEDLALLLDRILGTDEAAVTAVGLSDEDRSSRPALVRALQDRLDADLDPNDPRLRTGLPFHAPRRSMLLPFAVALVAAAFFLPPLRSLPSRAPSNDPVAEAERLAERKDALQREIGAELPTEVEQAFDDLIAALRKGDAGRREAEKRAEELDRKLTEMAKVGGEGSSAAFERAKDALAGVDAEAAQDLEDAGKQGDLEAAAAAVERMRQRMEKRDSTERKKAAEALKRAAQAAAKAGREDISKALENEAKRASGPSPEGGGQGGEQSQGEDGSAGQDGQDGSKQESGRTGEGSRPPQSGDPGVGEGQGASGDGLAEYLRRLDRQGVGAQIGNAARQRAMAQRLQGALEGAGGGNPYEASEGGSGRGGAGSGTGGWGAGTSHTDEAEGTSAEGTEHQSMNRQVSGVHRDWVTDFDQQHSEKRLEGIEAVTATVNVAIGDGPVDIEFLRRTGSNERSGRALVQAPPGYREAAEEAIDGEGVPRIYREQVKTYFDAIE
jgi:hypothetical protein